MRTSRPRSAVLLLFAVTNLASVRAQTREAQRLGLTSQPDSYVTPGAAGAAGSCRFSSPLDGAPVSATAKHIINEKWGLRSVDGCRKSAHGALSCARCCTRTRHRRPSSHTASTSHAPDAERANAARAGDAAWAQPTGGVHVWLRADRGRQLSASGSLSASLALSRRHRLLPLDRRCPLPRRRRRRQLSAPSGRSLRRTSVAPPPGAPHSGSGVVRVAVTRPAAV